MYSIGIVLLRHSLSSWRSLAAALRRAISLRLAASRTRSNAWKVLARRARAGRGGSLSSICSIVDLIVDRVRAPYRADLRFPSTLPPRCATDRWSPRPFADRLGACRSGSNLAFPCLRAFLFLSMFDEAKCENEKRTGGEKERGRRRRIERERAEGRRLLASTLLYKEWKETSHARTPTSVSLFFLQ